MACLKRDFCIKIVIQFMKFTVSQRWLTDGYVFWCGHRRLSIFQQKSKRHCIVTGRLHGLLTKTRRVFCRSCPPSSASPCLPVCSTDPGWFCTHQHLLKQGRAQTGPDDQNRFLFDIDDDDDDYDAAAAADDDDDDNDDDNETVKCCSFVGIPPWNRLCICIDVTFYGNGVTVLIWFVVCPCICVLATSQSQSFFFSSILCVTPRTLCKVCLATVDHVFLLLLFGIW